MTGASSNLCPTARLVHNLWTFSPISLLCPHEFLADQSSAKNRAVSPICFIDVLPKPRHSRELQLDHPKSSQVRGLH